MVKWNGKNKAVSDQFLPTILILIISKTIFDKRKVQAKFVWYLKQVVKSINLWNAFWYIE